MTHLQGASSYRHADSVVTDTRTCMFFHEPPCLVHDVEGVLRAADTLLAVAAKAEIESKT